MVVSQSLETGAPAWPLLPKHSYCLHARQFRLRNNDATGFLLAPRASELLPNLMPNQTECDPSNRQAGGFFSQ